eukprot:158687_1
MGRLATGLALVALIQVFLLQIIPGVNAAQPVKDTGDALREKVEVFTQQTGWVMATKSYCPYCKSAIQMFKDLKIECDVWELDKDKSGQEIQNFLFDITNQRTVPNVFYNGNHVGGFSDFKEAIIRKQKPEL